MLSRSLGHNAAARTLLTDIAPMIEKLPFVPDANLINRLGKELVAKQETALIELIKNSFDADATKVDVVLSGDFGDYKLDIIDNGNGMNRDELIDGFLRLGNSLKVKEARSPTFDRQRAGSKGIGRFAAQRLGDRLILTTRSSGSSHGWKLDVNWAFFQPGADLSKIEVELSEIDGCDVGTTLHIEQLRDRWTEAQLKRCWRGILGLQQPFPASPIEGNNEVDPGFVVRIRRHSDFLEDDISVIDMQSEVLNHLHAVIEMRVDHQGCATWRLSQNKFGDVRPWQPIHHSGDKSRTYPSLLDVWMKCYYVILAPELLPSLVYSRVRDVLAEFGGVRLYRNGFRVVPYGDPGNDWLRLDELYAKRSLLVPVGNRNFFGVIEVHDTTGTLFEEHTSREGLIETEAFNELKELASSVLVTAVTRIAEDRGKKSRAGRRPKTTQTDVQLEGGPLSEVTMAIQAVTEAADKAAASGNTASIQVATEARKALNVFRSKSSEVARAQADLADEANMLRFLATLGMTAAEFNHETTMTFDAFRLDFARIFEAVSSLALVDDKLRDQAERAKIMLARLDTLTSYMNSLASARAARGRSPISLTRAIEDFDQGIRLQAKSQNIELVTKIPSYDPLFTQPMHQAELASVLLNLYTNSVKAIKRNNHTRKIQIGAERLPDSRIRLRFQDTGDGIAPENRERVFDAFFTTNVAPPAGSRDVEHATGTGLGLWIVHQIVDNASGQIRVGEESEGFATCVEIDLPAEKEDEPE
jgi:signal transduction histidine kinase